MPATTFIESRFPTNVSLGTVGGPMFKTEIVEKTSGHEERNTPWSMPRYRFDAKYGIRVPADIYAVLEIYHVARGRLRGFRFKDHLDFKSCGPTAMATFLDQPLGVGNNVQTVFPLSKRYVFAADTQERRVFKPVADTIMVGVAGAQVFSGFSVDGVSGNVTFNVPPLNGSVLSWGGEFDVPVRFDADNLDITLQGPINELPSIPLIELRL